MLFCRLFLMLLKCLHRQCMIDEKIHCLLKAVFEPGNTPFTTNCFDRALLRLFCLFWKARRKNIDRCQQFFGPLKRLLLEDTDLHFYISLTSLGQYHNASLCLLVLISKLVSIGSEVWSYYF